MSLAHVIPGQARCDATAAVRANAAFESFCAAKYLPVLDALRALAVMMVVAYHCPPFVMPGLAMLQGAGDIGVDVFFVISGFLITTLIFREQRDGLGKRLGRFYVRRGLRIVPLYYLAIVVYGAKELLIGDAETWGTFAAFMPWLMTFCADVRLGVQPQPFPPLGIAWSLGVEEKFYLVWPVVAMCLSRMNVVRVGVAVIVAAIAWRAWLVMNGDGANAGRLYYAFDTRVDGIMWGCVAAGLLADRTWFGRLSAMLGTPLVSVCALVALVLAATAMESADPARYVVVPLLSCALVVSMIARPAVTGGASWMGRVIGWIGVVSYGVYLFHQPVIGLVRRVCGQGTDGRVLMTCVLSAALSVGVASALYVLYERPFLRLKKRFVT